MTLSANPPLAVVFLVTSAMLTACGQSASPPREPHLEVSLIGVARPPVTFNGAVLGSRYDSRQIGNLLGKDCAVGVGCEGESKLGGVDCHVRFAPNRTGALAEIRITAAAADHSRVMDVLREQFGPVDVTKPDGTAQWRNLDGTTVEARLVGDTSLVAFAVDPAAG